jgi:hypothetical protein
LPCVVLLMSTMEALMILLEASLMMRAIQDITRL